MKPIEQFKTGDIVVSYANITYKIIEHYPPSKLEKGYTVIENIKDNKRYKCTWKGSKIFKVKEL